MSTSSNNSRSEDSLRLTLSPPGSHALSDTSSSHAANVDPATSADAIEPAYPWSATRRAAVQPLSYLRGQGLATVEGDVKCKKCGRVSSVEIDVEAGFERVQRYYLAHRHAMHDRAPRAWMAPRLLDCPACGQAECARPHVDGVRKRHLNWLFLLLTQTLGLCKLEQLKYFCKHNRRHRTGAKDRVLYLTYVGLLKQLDPAGPYD